MKIKKSILLPIGVILLLLIATMLFSLFTINRLKSNLSWQIHTTTVTLKLKQNLTYLLNAETGERGFVLTLDTTYLEPYLLAVHNLDGNTKQLRTLTADNPVQQKNLDTLEVLISQKISRIVNVVALTKKGDENAARIMLAKKEAKYIMDKIRIVNNSMQEEEVKLSEKRIAATNASIANAKTIFIVEGVFSILITLLLAYIIFTEFDRRTKLEKQLTISSERFSKIFEENPIAMTLSEIGTNKIVFANNLYYKYFGYSKEEVIGHSSQELKLTSPEEDARLLQILLGYLHETRSVSELQALPQQEREKILRKLKQNMGNNGLEVLYTRKNGKTFYAILSYDIIEIDNKKYTITSYQDVSNRKEAENKIIAYSLELEEKNKEIERKNKEIEQFAYVASHDLQEPLRTVSNFSHLLAQKLEGHPDNEEQEYIKYIRSGTHRMSTLIFDLLEYSRIGKDMSKIPIDCNKLVSEVLTDLSGSIKESGAEIHTEKLPVVKGSINLKSLFQNLISNAIKFRKEGTHPVITISVKERITEFLFSIKDNGIGIEQTYHERIFLIFQRLHTRSEYEGTGIGLSQCKKIVELHGGKIWVDSEFGNGSTFNFTIPKT